LCKAVTDHSLADFRVLSDEVLEGAGIADPGRVVELEPLVLD
jgi:hypothetical protein